MEFNRETVYNIHEHNHTDETVWPNERLEARIADIRSRMARIAYTGARLAQNELDLDVLSFELTSRYKDTKISQEDEAWGTRV